MIEKLYKKVKNIQDFNETASKLRQMGLKDELKNLAGKYKVPEVDLKEFLSGKRYFLIDGGETQKDYMSARSKLLDEMFNQKEGLIPRSLLRNKLFQDMEEEIY